MHVHHIMANLGVPDLDTSKDFYTGFLGLSEEEFNLGWVARYTAPGTGASLQLVTRDATASQDAVVSVLTDDVDAAFAEAESRGLEIVHPLVREEWGVRRFLVRAPDGNVVNVVNHRSTVGADVRSRLEQVARGWELADPDLAADAFCTDAVYLEPPDRRRHVGREALRRFFHGPDPAPRRMRMTWHAVAADPSGQRGFGEYTVASGDVQAHGVVAVALREGRIATWREYQHLPDERFTGDSLG